jgi:phospholipid transport system substrate-binding protein
MRIRVRHLRSLAMSFLWRDLAPLVSAAPPLPRPSIARLPIARRRLLAGLALGTALAAASTRANRALAAEAADAEGAKQFVGDTADKAIALMADKGLPEAQQTERFRALIDAAFDLPAIGQTVLGRYWKNATLDQRQRFLALFEQQEVLTWSHRFKSYNGQRLTVEEAAADNAAPGAFRVVSHIDQLSGQPIPLEWQVRQSDGWRIVDIAIENASMALTLRQDFGSVLGSNGGKIDALLDAMQKKIDQLKSAT